MGKESIKSKSKTVVTKAKRHSRPKRIATAKPSGVGVVNFCVQGSVSSPNSAKFTPAKLVEALQDGLPFQELEDLQAGLAVPTEKLAPMLGISKATFHRRKGDASKLSAAVSDRVVRYARLLGQTVRVFDSMEAANEWLNAPQIGLGGAVPLNYAKTEIGSREVESLLGRIEYSVYS